MVIAIHCCVDKRVIKYESTQRNINSNTQPCSPSTLTFKISQTHLQNWDFTSGMPQI
ncbi:hypothetical protein L873DRAFT_1822173 [Choiromyces venosus 120613-1]|uniref:Uncharacterized protein n=1 Tax=Choiromyces venosus 120613-1 TaxID=1336337 RepID=A0A3N4IUB9_9PEZI|nr:hypothetical protein L873DRAFT_1822173 [Choiromyces venosus 120613-1]